MSEQGEESKENEWSEVKHRRKIKKKQNVAAMKPYATRSQEKKKCPTSLSDTNEASDNPRKKFWYYGRTLAHEPKTCLVFCI